MAQDWRTRRDLYDAGYRRPAARDDGYRRPDERYCFAYAEPERKASNPKIAKAVEGMAQLLERRNNHDGK